MSACNKIIVIIAALLAAIAAVAAVPLRFEKLTAEKERFVALGDLPGGTEYSVATDVSEDGLVVVGSSNSHAGMEAFRWTQREGMVGLGCPRASATNADGSVVAGFRLLSGASEPIRWTQSGGLQGLGNVAGLEYGSAFAVNANGSVIVGSGSCHDPHGSEAFYWSAAGGLVPLQPLPWGAISVEPYAVSADGDVVVGAFRYASGRHEAFRWTPNRGGRGLGALRGDTHSYAHSVSADGSLIVGESESASGSAEAFRWTRESGMVGLGTLVDGIRCSRALGVSADGSTIVGESYGPSGLEAFVWDAAHGMRSLRQVLFMLPNMDRRLRGWKLTSATSASADGSVIVGFGLNPNGEREAWIARLGHANSLGAPVRKSQSRRGLAGDYSDFVQVSASDRATVRE